MIWCEFSNLVIPKSLVKLPVDGEFPAHNILSSITFYIPPYMAGRQALELISQMTSLQVIQSPNAGVDDVLAYLPAGVTLCNARGVHDASTAE